MTYRKPELSDLGTATELIQGSKMHLPDAGSPNDPGNNQDFEFND